MMYPVTIGHSEVKVNPLGLGTNAVGGYNLFPDLDDQAGIDLVKTALDNGINLLDTAYVYGLGHSEELIGQAIQDYDRHKIIIATKGAHDFSTGKEVINNDPDSELVALCVKTEKTLSKAKEKWLFLLLCLRLALNLLRQYRLRLSRAKEKKVFLLLCIRLALYLHSKPLTTTFQYARRKEMPQRLRGKNGNERHAPRRKARSNSRR